MAAVGVWTGTWVLVPDGSLPWVSSVKAQWHRYQPKKLLNPCISYAPMAKIY